MQKDTRKKGHAYKVAMLLKYWKAANKEPITDLCMIIVIYAQDIEAGLLYAVGHRTALATDYDGYSENTDTLSRIIVQNKDGKEAFVKGVMNGNSELNVFLFENGTVRVAKRDGSPFDIALESEIIAMNSGNCCNSLFIVDAKMRVYEIKDETPIRVTGLSDGLKIKDISCGYEFTVFLSKCGRAFVMGLNGNSTLGLPRKIEETEIPTEIVLSNQSDSDKNGIMITMIHASDYGWVAVDSKQRVWIVGSALMKSIRSDYESLDPCISIVEVWYTNDIRITQIKCGYSHVIALSTDGRMYWFGNFPLFGSLSNVSSDPILFSHRITEIRSGFGSVACKDATNEWYVWGWNSYNHITGLCGCEAVCKRTSNHALISNPMQCEWLGLFNATNIIDLRLGFHKTYVIMDLA